jgi:DNA-binding NtrC family response regulator
MKKIIIVDSDPNILSALSNEIDLEYVLVTVSNSRKVIQLLEMGGYDLLIIGPGVYDRERSDLILLVQKADPDLPIVLISDDFKVQEFDKNRVESFLTGYIEEPVRHKEVKDIVDKIFNNSQKMRGLGSRNFSDNGKRKLYSTEFYDD